METAVMIMTIWRCPITLCLMARRAIRKNTVLHTTMRNNPYSGMEPLASTSQVSRPSAKPRIATMGMMAKLEMRISPLIPRPSVPSMFQKKGHGPPVGSRISHSRRRPLPYTNLVRPHLSLPDNMAPGEAAGIKVEGNDKILTIIQAAAKSTT